VTDRHDEQATPPPDPSWLRPWEREGEHPASTTTFVSPRRKRRSPLSRLADVLPGRGGAPAEVEAPSAREAPPEPPPNSDTDTRTEPADLDQQPATGATVPDDLDRWFDDLDVAPAPPQGPDRDDEPADDDAAEGDVSDAVEDDAVEEPTPDGPSASAEAPPAPPELDDEPEADEPATEAASEAAGEPADARAEPDEEQATTQAPDDLRRGDVPDADQELVDEPVASDLLDEQPDDTGASAEALTAGLEDDTASVEEDPDEDQPLAVAAFLDDPDDELDEVAQADAAAPAEAPAEVDLGEPDVPWEADTEPDATLYDAAPARDPEQTETPGDEALDDPTAPPPAPGQELDDSDRPRGASAEALAEPGLDEPDTPTEAAPERAATPFEEPPPPDPEVVTTAEVATPEDTTAPGLDQEVEEVAHPSSASAEALRRLQLAEREVAPREEAEFDEQLDEQADQPRVAEASAPTAPAEALADANSSEPSDAAPEGEPDDGAIPRTEPGTDPSPPVETDRLDPSVSAEALAHVDIVEHDADDEPDEEAAEEAAGERNEALGVADELAVELDEPGDAAPTASAEAPAADLDDGTPSSDEDPDEDQPLAVAAFLDDPDEEAPEPEPTDAAVGATGPVASASAEALADTILPEEVDTDAGREPGDVAPTAPPGAPEDVDHAELVDVPRHEDLDQPGHAPTGDAEFRDSDEPAEERGEAVGAVDEVDGQPDQPVATDASGPSASAEAPADEPDFPEEAVPGPIGAPFEEASSPDPEPEADDEPDEQPRATDAPASTAPAEAAIDGGSGELLDTVPEDEPDDAATPRPWPGTDPPPQVEADLFDASASAEALADVDIVEPDADDEPGEAAPAASAETPAADLPDSTASSGEHPDEDLPLAVAAFLDDPADELDAVSEPDEAVENDAGAPSASAESAPTVEASASQIGVAEPAAEPVAEPGAAEAEPDETEFGPWLRDVDEAARDLDDTDRRARRLLAGAALSLLVVAVVFGGVRIAQDRAADAAREQAALQQQVTTLAADVLDLADVVGPTAASTEPLAGSLLVTLEEHLLASERSDAELDEERTQAVTELRAAADQLRDALGGPAPVPGTLVPSDAADPVLLSHARLRAESTALAAEADAAADRADTWGAAVRSVTAALATHARIASEQPETTDPTELAESWRAEVAPLQALADVAADVATLPGLQAWAEAHAAFAEDSLAWVERAATLLEDGELETYNTELEETLGVDDPFGFSAALADATLAALDSPALDAVATVEARAALVVDQVEALERTAGERLAAAVDP